MKTMTVAIFLEQQIALCGKSQRVIAAECGYPNPNIITMFKSGSTKIPVNKAGALAKSLDVDPAFFLRLLMCEYMPEAWAEIESILGRDSVLSEQDLAIANLARESSGDLPIDLSITDNRNAFIAVIKDIAARDQERAKAAIRRIEALPKNARTK